MTTAPPLRNIDLFSGIGGFTLAMQSISQTVAYCDIDPLCRKTIARNIERGKLIKAPIFEDIQTLDATKDLMHLKPNMITAGFPCTDISSANPNGKGLRGLRSGLFSHILRLIDDLQTIQVVFLENSPRIMKKGLNTIKRHFQSRGFIVKYCITHALDVGAPHRRKRWYCLCYKPALALPSVKLPTINPKLMRYPWHREPPNIPTLLRIEDRHTRDKYVERCAMLGNAIVPQCAMNAWNMLTAPTPDTYVSPPVKPRDPMNITLSDGNRIVKRDYWATPTHSTWHNYRSLTDRGIGILSNQLYYDARNANIGKHAHEYTANPRYVEWMMGYHNWT
jgi:DNA (cytosine-5)-methyltransferase 1